LIRTVSDEAPADASKKVASGIDASTPLDVVARRKTIRVSRKTEMATKRIAMTLNIPFQEGIPNGDKGQRRLSDVRANGDLHSVRIEISSIDIGKNAVRSEGPSGKQRSRVLVSEPIPSIGQQPFHP